MAATGIAFAPLVLAVIASGLALRGIAASGQAESGTDMAKVERYLQERLEKDGFPSLSVGIVREDGLVWAKATEGDEAIVCVERNDPLEPSSIEGSTALYAEQVRAMKDGANGCDAKSVRAASAVSR
jgi:hypothetical protein